MNLFVQRDTFIGVNIVLNMFSENNKIILGKKPDLLSNSLFILEMNENIT